MEIEFSEKKRWVFFGLPLTFTKYDVKENIITINSGFLNKVENDCYPSAGIRLVPPECWD